MASEKTHDLEQRFNALYASLKTYVSDQVSAGAWDAQNNWTDYSDANFPHIHFTVPPSGAVKITISIGVNNTGGTLSALAGWRISGTDTVAADTKQAVSVMSATIGARASKTIVVTGLTAGATDTVTPCWYRSAGSASDTGDGQLIVEPAWA